MAVHALLASTKKLQSVLEDWSQKRADENEVSDVYVQIGTEFNLVVAAFAYHQIDLRCVLMRSELSLLLTFDPELQ